MPALLLTLLLIAIGWFLLIRPQQARLREQKAMIAALQVGDRVITAGGIHGTITGASEETLRVTVAPGVEITLARPAVAHLVDDPAGTNDTKDAQVEDTVTEPTAGAEA